jgi:hypothetical protein
VKHLGTSMVVLGALAIVLPGAPPPWVALALVGAGLAYSLAWRAVGVRRVSARERRKHAARLRNAERRERRHLRATERLGRRMKQVLAEVREHPDLKWGEQVAGVVRQLQADVERHEAVLLQAKMLQEKTARDLGEVFNKVESE